MRCWFHKWTTWSEIFLRENKWGHPSPYQHRVCLKCKKVEERRV